MSLISRFMSICESSADELITLREKAINKDLDALDAWWYQAAGIGSVCGHVYATTHSSELTEYGRILHFEFPKLISQLREAAAKTLLKGK